MLMTLERVEFQTFKNISAQCHIRFVKFWNELNEIVC